MTKCTSTEVVLIYVFIRNNTVPEKLLFAKFLVAFCNFTFKNRAFVCCKLHHINFVFQGWYPTKMFLLPTKDVFFSINVKIFYCVDKLPLHLMVKLRNESCLKISECLTFLLLQFFADSLSLTMHDFSFHSKINFVYFH